jgi:histidinol phosphatase-like enzyme
MITQAVREHRIDVSNSFLVGDKASDLEAAERAGLLGRYIVRSGGCPLERNGHSGEFESLAAVVDHILGKRSRPTA